MTQKNNAAAVNDMVKQIVEDRENILKAFIAQYGYEPGRVIQVEQKTEDGTRWFVRRKTDAEMRLGELVPFLDEHIDLMKAGMQKGVIKNKTLVVGMLRMKLETYAHVRHYLEQAFGVPPRRARDAAAPEPAEPRTELGTRGTA
jgi:hypothetical protein